MSNRAPQIEAPSGRKFLARLLLLAVPIIYTLVLAGGEPTSASAEDTSRVAYAAAASSREVVAPKSCPDGKVLAEDHSCVPSSFYDKPVEQPRKVKAAQDKARKSVAVEHGTVSGKCWSALRAAGYKGKAGDGREAIYVPAKRLAELCGSKADRKPSAKVKADAKAEKAEKAAARKAHKQDQPRKSVAEDGSKVNAGFYDRTDYNADGVADQEQGWSKNPNSDDVKAGRK